MFRLRRIIPFVLSVIVGLALFEPNPSIATIDKDTQLQNVEIRLGERTFRVPDSYLNDFSRIPAWLRWMPGLDDDSRSMLMRIPAQTVSAFVPGYDPQNNIGDEDLNLIVSVLNEQELKAYTNPSWIRDIWQNTNRYRGRIVERDHDSGSFRVYSENSYGVIWNVLKDNPDHVPLNGGHYSMWLGGCTASAGENPAGIKRSCLSFVLYENIHIQFRVRGKNLKHADRIREFLVQQVKTWLEG